MTRQLRLLLSRGVSDLDITLAALGCILAVPLTIYLHAAMRSPVFVVVGVIVFLTCLAYLLIRRRRSALVQTQPEATPRVYLLLNILFFGLLTYSILAFYLRPEPYTRPLGYFVALAAMAAVLAVEILFMPSRRSAAPFALFKILLISLSLTWSPLLTYPGIMAHDPWYHGSFVTGMLEAGQIPSGSLYSRLPGMHLVIGGTSLITGLEYKPAAMLSVSLLQVLSNILFIFLLGKLVHSVKAGLLAALVLGFANWHLIYASHTIPLSMAVVFIPIVAYLLLKLRQQRPRASICLATFFMLSLLITHAVAAVMLGLVLACLWLGSQIYRTLRYGPVAATNTLLGATTLFTLATLSYWRFVSGHIRILSFLTGTGFGGEFFDRLPPGEVTPPPEALPSMLTAIAYYHDHIITFGEKLFNQLGFILYFAFAALGALVMVSKSTRDRSGFAFVFAGLAVLSLTFFGIVTFRAFLEERWYHLSQILLSIPGGIALLWVAGLPKKSLVRASLLGTISFTLAFLMVVTPQLNKDNRTFAPNIVYSIAYTRSELQAVETVSGIYDGRIGIDNYSLRSFQLALAPDNEISAIDEPLHWGHYASLEDMLVLIREEIVRNPFRPVGGVFRLEHNPRGGLTEHGFSKVYDSGSVSGFIKLGLRTDT